MPASLPQPVAGTNPHPQPPPIPLDVHLSLTKTALIAIIPLALPLRSYTFHLLAPTSTAAELVLPFEVRHHGTVCAKGEVDLRGFYNGERISERLKVRAEFRRNHGREAGEGVGWRWTYWGWAIRVELDLYAASEGERKEMEGLKEVDGGGGKGKGKIEGHVLPREVRDWRLRITDQKPWNIKG